MVKANTPGKNDGEVKYWIDGKVAGDFPNLNLRSISTLKLDHARFMLHSLTSERLNQKWYDNVVIATKYIGPMATATPSPIPTATPTATPTPTPTPRNPYSNANADTETSNTNSNPTPTPTPTPTASPTPTPTPPFGTPTPPPSPTPTPAAQLQNISSRLLIQTGNNVGIAGFIVGGTEPKKLLIRGLGPTLAQFNVVDVLQNPTLELHDGSGSLIATNDNWKDTQQAEITTTQLAPPADAEAAILATLQPGAYTAIEAGARGGTGVGLIEVYDVDPLAASRLINISTRGLVQTGNNLLIGGFIISGQPQQVLIRALGPTLGQPPFNVPNSLGDPQLTLFNSTGTAIASNDNWQNTVVDGTTITGSQVSEIQNSGKAPPSANESTIIATLPPGNYTAIVSGVSNTTGIGLVEVYTLR